MADNHNTADSNETDRLGSRRRFLAATGAGILTGVAGCSGDGGTDGGDGNDSDGGDGSDGNGGDGNASDGGTKRVDATWSATMWSPADDKIQWNRWNGQNRLGSVESDIYANVGTFDGINRKFLPVMAEDWAYKPEETQFDLTLIDGATWTNGDDVTARDIVVRWQLEKYVTATEEGLKNGEIKSSSQVWNYAESVEAVNDRTVRFNLGSKVNSQLLKNSVINDAIAVNRNVYGEWLKRFKEAPKEVKKYNKVREEFLNWKLQDPVGSDVWEISDMATSKVTLSLRPDHPLAEKINFTTKARYAAETNKEHWALFKSGTTNSLGAAAPETVEQSFPDTTVHVKNLIPNYFGSGIGINFNDPILGMRKVRQALAYAIDPRAPAENAGGYIPIVDNFSGMGGGPAGVPQNILGDFANELVDYDVTEGTGGKDWERASNLLKEAGFTKESGTWKTPDGKTFQLPMTVVAAHSDMVRMFQTIVGQLKEFGIKAKMDTVEGATFWDRTGRGDFRVAEAFWVSAFPVNSYAGYWQHESATTEAYGYPQKVQKIPAMPGNEGTTTINAKKVVDQLYQESDAGKQKQLYQKLAWAFNHDLPLIPIEERMLGYIHNPGDKFTVPTLDDTNGALDGQPTGRKNLAAQFDKGGFIRRGLIAAKQG